MSLAFAGGSIVSGHSDIWMGPFIVCLCLAIAGGAMLFFPERAFRTETKPRWVGLPLLIVGVIGACMWGLLGLS